MMGNDPGNAPEVCAAEISGASVFDSDYGCWEIIPSDDRVVHGKTGAPAGARPPERCSMSSPMWVPPVLT